MEHLSILPNCIIIKISTWACLSFTQVRVFINQLYQPNVVKDISRNPDLQAIRIASVNPILDPWIYILLRKTVLSKAIEKIKCLFCRIGGSGRDSSAQHCSESRRTSSAMSGHSRSFQT